MPRNSSGTYSLPSGNPVVSNTLIQSTWANTTLSDVSTAMTDSLDRNGRGAMLAALKNIDGTAVAPSITFSSEGTLGIYRVSAGVLGIAAAGALVLSISAAGLTFTNPLVLPIGSATAPSVTFVSNTNTGLYSPGTNQVALTTNGVGALFVSASQNVGIGGANALGKLQVIGGDVVIDNAANYSAKNSGGTASSIMALSSGNQLQFGNSGAVISMAWATGGATRLNLTNTALQPSVIIVSAMSESMRTTNDAGFISFYNTASTTRTGYIQANTGATLVLMAENGAALALGTNSTTRVTLDTAGNIGLAVAPSAWGTSQKALQLGSNGFIYGNTSQPTQLVVGGGAYFNGTNWLYSASQQASYYQQLSGAHSWFIAPSGTAGNTVTFTQAMTLDNSGNLLVGSTSSSWGTAGRGVIEVNGTTNSLVGLKVNGAQGGYLNHTGTDYNIVNNVAGALQLGTNSAVRLIITSAGVIQDAAGNELGYRGLPQSIQGSAYTFVAADRGKHIYINAAVNVTVPASVFSTGDVLTVINGTGGSITLVQGTSVNLYQAGTANTGNRTILVHGICTLVCTQGSSSSFFVSGNVT
jgi:hypothetical protein